MSNNNNIPGWVDNIRTGRFDEAASELTSAAAQQVHTQLMANQISAEVEKINQSNPYAKYVANAASEAVQHAYQTGKIQTPQQLVDYYRKAMDTEVETFKQTVRPGYMRDQYNPSVPADAEVADYIQSRKAEKARLIEEGKRIPNLTGGR